MKRIILLTVGALMLFALIAWTAWSNTAVELNTYQIYSPKLPNAFDGYRIAHVSDLHNAEIGEDNQILLTMLRDAQPNIIVITGDLIDSRSTDIELALAFAEEAAKIAPCYYVTGNHESRIANYETLKAGLVQRRVVVLEDESLNIMYAGEEITLIGVNDPSFHNDDAVSDSASMTNKLAQITRQIDSYTVLLSHRPDLFDVYAESHVDLVLSGHAHGGQFRLPFVGGLIAPNQGLFPEYDAGLYTSQETSMIVSRGIGNSLFPFRFNNPPEVILIELKTA